MYETYLKIDIKIDAANDIRKSFRNFDNNLGKNEMFKNLR